MEDHILRRFVMMTSSNKSVNVNVLPCVMNSDILNFEHHLRMACLMLNKFLGVYLELDGEHTCKTYY